MKQERRQQPRIPVNPEFAPVVGEEGIFAQDLSEQGVFLRTLEVHPVGTQLRVRFSVLADDVFVFDLKAEVRRCCESHPRGLGLRFIDLSPAHRTELKRVLALSDLRHRWEEGAEVSRGEWDKVQKALRQLDSKAEASSVEFGALKPPSREPKAVDEDEVTRVFYYEGKDDPPPKSD